MAYFRQQAEAETTSKPEVKVGKLQSRNTFESRHQESNDTDSAKVNYLLYIYIYWWNIWHLMLSFLNEAAKNAGKAIVFWPVLVNKTKDDPKSTDIYLIIAVQEDLKVCIA